MMRYFGRRERYPVVGLLLECIVANMSLDSSPFRISVVPESATIVASELKNRCVLSYR